MPRRLALAALCGWLLFPILADADEGGAGASADTRVDAAVERRLNEASARLRRMLFEVLDEELGSLGRRASGRFESLSDALRTLTPAEALRHVEVLAADEFEGREGGEPGAWMAAEYVRDRFREYGLEAPDPEASYFQDFTLPGRKLAAPPTLSLLDAGGVRRAFAEGALDFVPFSFTDSGVVDAPLVFVGYGITAPEHQYDDYAGIDVRGKVVLCLRHEPAENDPKSRFLGKRNTQHAWFVAKARRAKEAGAAGFLLVTDPNAHAMHLPLSSASLTTGEMTAEGRRTIRHLTPEALRAESTSGPALEHLFVQQARTIEGPVGLPAFHVSLETARALLSASSGTVPPLEEIQRGIDDTQAPNSFPVPGVRVSMSVSTAPDDRRTCNVAGLLRGSHPTLREEVVVIGAHYDHVGRNAEGEVWNGADDNASGTAALLQAARAAAAVERRPDRSILFLAFGAEEKGLLGSMHYVNHPLIPLDRTVAMINLDMVGRGDDDIDGIFVLGRETSPELSAMLDEANGPLGMRLSDDRGLFENSDHFSFYSKNIPVLFLNSGLHNDYHQPTDEAHTILPGKIRRCAQLVTRLAWRVAGAPQRPTFAKLPPRAGGRPRLGVVPRPIGPEQRTALGLGPDRTGIELAEVMPDLPAAKAGLQAGDIVVEIGGAAIPATNAEGVLRRRLMDHPKETPLHLKVWRAGEWREIDVYLE